MTEAKHDIVIGAMDLEQNDFTLCLEEDKVLSTKLSQAMDSTDSNQFAFFDLDLSNQEMEALNVVNVTGFKNWGIFDDELSYLSEITDTFLRRFALSEINHAAAPTIINLISKLVRVIISESNYGSCKVTLRACPPVNNHVSKWHIDKTFEEIIGMEPHFMQNVFIITLKGAPTLFYKPDAEQLDSWHKQAEESYFFYVVDGFEAVTLKDRIVSPKIGQGSVHKASSQYGAIHASPDPNTGRLLVLITPDNRETVQAIQRFERYHLYASNKKQPMET
jgi:hypothetical protein